MILIDPPLPNPNLKSKDVLTVAQLKMLSPGDVVEVLWEDIDALHVVPTWYQGQVKKATTYITLPRTRPLNRFLLTRSH